MARKKTPTSPEHPWFGKAAELIVRESKTPWQAFTEVGAEMLSSEAETIFRSKPFQQILWAERQKFYRELANTPGRDKTSALGLLYYLAQKLIDSGEYDKAAVVIEKLMKAEGQTGTDNQINVFAGLSPKDYAQLTSELERASKEKTIQ